MSDEMYTFALKTTLNEIKKTCPTVKQAFIFAEDPEITTADDSVDAPTLRNAVNAVKAIIQHAKAIGGINTITFNSANGTAHVTHIENLYLTTITAKETDQTSINTLTQALIPIILKLLTKIPTIPLDSPAPSSQEATATALEKETFLPKPPVNQLLIDDLNGFLVPQDTVRIDNAIIAQWSKLYPDKRIEQVEVEALNGETTRCKFKPAKDSHEGNGTIQMPEKIQLALQIKKGELVMIKPVIK